MAHRSESTATPGIREGARRLAAIVFTDIVGYSALVNRDDANAMRLVEEHFALVRKIAASFGGKIIKTIGDSVHLEFASAQAATACSIAIQQAHQQRNTRVAEAQHFDIRIGIHTGDVEHRDGDIYGDGVNIAARLQPLAPAGGIAISDHVRGQLRLDLRNRFTSRGTPTLKNIETPLELFVLEGESLAGIEVDTPGPEVAAPAPARLEQKRRLPIVVAAVVVAAALAVGAALLPNLRSKSPISDVSDTSIAVLPFANLSSDKEQEYFSDGISEDLLNLLTRVETLQVAARTSSFSFKGQNVEVPEIARRLHVAHLLQGSVRKSGNAVRITAQLVRARDGFQVWSQSWDRQLDDVFKIQDEIAQAVVAQLKVHLLGAVPTAKPVDPRVYPLILQAEALTNQQSAAGRIRAAELLRQVLEITPDEARAWAGLSRVYANQATFGENPEGAKLAKEAANKALEFDPANPRALGMLAAHAMNSDRDLPTAATYLQRALEVTPDNASVISAACALLSSIGRAEEARRLIAYAAAQDPANPTMFHNLGFYSYSSRHWDGSIEASRTAIELSPEVSDTRAQLGGALLVGKRDAAGALEAFESEPNEVTRLVGRSQALHALGRTTESDAVLKTLIEKFGAEQPEYVATVYGHRGDVDRAFEWLEKAVAINDPGLSTVLTEPFFDALHDDPRWIPFLRKIGYAPEQLAKVRLDITLPDSAVGK